VIIGRRSILKNIGSKITSILSNVLETFIIGQDPSSLKTLFQLRLKWTILILRRSKTLYIERYILSKRQYIEMFPHSLKLKS